MQQERDSTGEQQAWSGRAISARALTVTAIILVAADVIAVSLRRLHESGDFDISMEFGRRFLQGRYLYQGGLHFPYMPSAAMWFSVFARFPSPIAFGLSYGLAIAFLWMIMRILGRITVAAKLLQDDRVNLVIVITLALASHFIIRDLDDGGPNIILLGMIVAGVYLASRGQVAGGAICLGLATAIKATAGIFIPFLAWKRQPRLAIYTMVAAAFWILLPIIRMGPGSWWAHQREWFDSAIGFALGHNATVESFAGYHNVLNQALRPALIRLMAGRIGVTPARAVASGIGLMVVGIFCWLTRHPYGNTMTSRWLVESSGLMILAVMMAPIAWVQHMVLVVPAIFLITAYWCSGRKFGIFASAAMAAYVVLALGLNRELLGKARYAMAQSYGVQTIAMLLVLGVLMSKRDTNAET